MKKLFARHVVICAALLVAAPVAQAGDRQTTWATVHETLPAGDFPCGITGVVLDVTHQFRLSVWSDTRGDVHVTVHFNTMQFRATDSAGNEYSGTHQINVEQFGVLLPTVPPSLDTRVYTDVSNIRLVGHGSAPNLLMKGHIVFVVSATGEATAQLFVSEWSCVAD